MAGMDGLNALPDSLLHRILSYLPTKEAVRAQLISKRWKNMWADLPVLDFDFVDFWSGNMGNADEHVIIERLECQEKSVVKVIDDVLASRQIQQIDTFKLVWQYQVKMYRHYEHPVRRWILDVLEHSPRVLSIYAQPTISDVEVPDTAFTCSTLKEMRLQIDNFEPESLPLLVNLLCLRKLDLGYYTIKADFMRNLLLGCLNLQELELYACRLDLSHISSDSLKS